MTEPNTNQQAPENADVEVDVDAVSQRLDKYMQRLPWAMSKVSPLPNELHGFLSNWLLPILNDLYLLTSVAVSMNDDNDDQVAQMITFSQQALLAAQSTLQGESLALLHMHFDQLQNALVDKLAPTDPASYALAEMHEVFVKLGLSAPYIEPAADDVAGSVDLTIPVTDTKVEPVPPA